MVVVEIKIFLLEKKYTYIYMCTGVIDQANVKERSRSRTYARQVTLLP